PADFRHGEAGPMRILVSGSTGLVGSGLVPRLQGGGHQVTRLLRTPPAADAGALFWNPADGRLDPAALEGFDAIIHLAGESIAWGRWTKAKKARIGDSRFGSTRLLAESMTRLSRPPSVFLCASATGYYGDRGDEVLTEDSAPGSGFLPGVCRAWEAAA